MVKNEHQSEEYWLIDIVRGKKFEEVLDSAPDCFELLDRTPECCIYKVPQYLRKINEEAYTPSLISIGPLHYARKELMGMEGQKKKYWSKFGKRVNAPKLEEMKTYIKHQETHIRGHYSVASKLKSSEYVEMILHDAVFVIELFLQYSQNDQPNDFLLNETLITAITTDLLLLENQLPYSVLNDLFMKAFPNRGENSFFDLQCLFFEFPEELSKEFSEKSQVKHFTDILRCTFLMKAQPTVQPKGGSLDDLPNATKLKKSGVKFGVLEGKGKLDISFEKTEPVKCLPWFGVKKLQIPQIEIFDDTESKFRNLMALEMFCYPTQTHHICDFVDLMDYLIDTAKDVDLLVEKKIIVNFMGDIEPIANMFNRLCSHVIVSNHSCYFHIAKEMKDHYSNRCNHLKATLKSVYFSNLWVGTATIAAAFLLILTLAQTVFSGMQL